MSDWAVVTQKTINALQRALETFDQRGSVYRDNHQRLGALLAALFPNGIEVTSPDEHERLALLSLIAIKLSRYAVEWNNGGHRDSIHDIIVYAAMLEARTAADRTGHGLCVDKRPSIPSAK
jgi:hypothetical protein